MEAAHHCLCLEVSILRADDLILHHVLDNDERLFALVTSASCLNLTLAATCYLCRLLLMATVAVQ